eukprot:Skav221840  [mRNA]  locus=scaffold126:58033:59083:+ [translate_table: standard]
MSAVISRGYMFSLLCGLWQWFLQKEESMPQIFSEICIAYHSHSHSLVALSSVPVSKLLQERRMVLLGVDNAGKTTTLEQLKALFGLKAMAPDRRGAPDFMHWCDVRGGLCGPGPLGGGQADAAGGGGPRALEGSAMAAGCK